MQRRVKMSMTEQEVIDAFQKVKNWGLWGKEDEQGTLNYITDEVRREAMKCVEDGTTVMCGLQLETAPTANNNNPAQWNILVGGDVAPPTGFGKSTDYIGLAPHGPSHTHLDALCHVFYDGLMYNGRSASMVASTGAKANSVTAVEKGVVSRGVLLDFTELRGVDFIEPEDPVRRSEVEAAERQAGVQVRAGDCVMMRVGRHARQRAKGPGCDRLNGLSYMPGLDPECLFWLHERKIALLGSDSAHDVMPSPYMRCRTPIHVGSLVFMGLHLLDNAWLDDLAVTCKKLDRRDFLFTLSPLRIPGGTASPVNPIAIF